MDDPVTGSKAEQLKAASDHLRGAIADELGDDGPAFSGDSATLLKFHGVYQQDDRDVRSERRRQGRVVAHICRVRVSTRGGVLPPGQYLVMDQLADAVGH